MAEQRPVKQPEKRGPRRTQLGDRADRTEFMRGYYAGVGDVGPRPAEITDAALAAIVNTAALLRDVRVRKTNGVYMDLNFFGAMAKLSEKTSTYRTFLREEGKLTETPEPYELGRQLGAWARANAYDAEGGRIAPASPTASPEDDLLLFVGLIEASMGASVGRIGASVLSAARRRDQAEEKADPPTYPAAADQQQPPPPSGMAVPEAAVMAAENLDPQENKVPDEQPPPVDVQPVPELSARSILASMAPALPPPPRMGGYGYAESKEAADMDHGVRNGRRPDVREFKQMDMEQLRQVASIARLALRQRGIGARAVPDHLARAVETVVDAMPAGSVPDQAREELLSDIIQATHDGVSYEEAQELDDIARHTLWSTISTRNVAAMMAVPAFIYSIRRAAAQMGTSEGVNPFLVAVMSGASAAFGEWLAGRANAPVGDAEGKEAPREAKEEPADPGAGAPGAPEGGRDMGGFVEDVAAGNVDAAQAALPPDLRADPLVGDALRAAVGDAVRANQMAAAVWAFVNPITAAAARRLGFGGMYAAIGRAIPQFFGRGPIPWQDMGRVAAEAGAINRMVAMVKWALSHAGGGDGPPKVSDAARTLGGRGFTKQSVFASMTPEQRAELEKEQVDLKVVRDLDQEKTVQELRPEFQLLGTVWDRETPQQAADERRRFAMFDYVATGENGDPRSIVSQQNREWDNQMRWNMNWRPDMQPVEFLQPDVQEYITYRQQPYRRPVPAVSYIQSLEDMRGRIIVSDDPNLGGTGMMRDPLYVPMMDTHQVAARYHQTPESRPGLPLVRQYPPTTDARRFMRRDVVQQPTEGTTRPSPPAMGESLRRRRTEAQRMMLGI